MTLQNLIDIDASVLDGVQLVPAEISSEILRNEIVMQCGLLRPVYPEPEVFKQLATQFFRARSWEFEHLVNIIKAEYSPIDNVSEEREEIRDISRKTDRDDTRMVNRALNETDSRSELETREETQDSNSSTSGHTENKISAFNASDYQPDNRSDSTSNANAGVNTEGERETTESGTKKVDDDTTDKLSGKTDETTKDIYTVKRHGNIGVTTNFELIQGELTLLHDFNIYKWIALQFRSALMIEVF